MCWIFFTLLAVNIAVLSYQQWEVYANTPIVLSSELKPKSTPSLVLLEELSAQNQSIESIRLKESMEEPSSGSGFAVTDQSVCVLVGAFPEQVKAEYFVRRLASLGVKAKVKNVLVSTTVGFWLHLPPLASRKELFRRLSELQRQGVDSYVIPDGDLENGISLGMFSEVKRAELLKSKIVSLGYKPKIAEVPREKRELWVFLFQPEAAKIDQQMWLKLLSGKKTLKKQKKTCSDVASA